MSAATALVRRVTRLHPRLERAGRLARRRWLSRGSGYPDWERVLGSDREAWRAAESGSGPRVLLATSVGSELAAVWLESLLAVALGLRGARAEVLLCDAVLPACEGCSHMWFRSTGSFAASGPQARLCDSCHVPAARAYAALGLPVRRYSEWIDEAARAEAARLSRDVPLAQIGELRWQGLAVGEHATAGALRHLARAELGGEETEGLLRRYLHAALLTAAASLRLLGEIEYRCVVMHHGIYVPQGLLSEAARRRGIRQAVWNPGYRSRTFVFSHEATYHRTLLEEPDAVWQEAPWTPEMRARTLAYLEGRRRADGDWIWFHERDALDDPPTIARRLALDPKRPVVGLLTNVAWDAQLHYPRNAFRDMFEWLLCTLDWFAKRPDLQLVIRVHPAERSGWLPSAQPAAAVIRERFGTLPENVRLIDADDPIGTYAAMELCDAVVIYGTKTGVELAAAGIPVIVAGEAWVRGKGITEDADDVEAYLRLLEGLPFGRRLPPERRERALRYAHHFFFRRMIPLQVVRPAASDWQLVDYDFDGLDPLRPGACSGLDVICRGILEGTPFVHEP